MKEEQVTNSSTNSQAARNETRKGRDSDRELKRERDKQRRTFSRSPQCPQSSMPLFVSNSVDVYVCCVCIAVDE